jgi:hypothetical protein
MLRNELGVGIGLVADKVEDVLAGGNAFVDVVGNAVAVPESGLLKADEGFDKCALLRKLADCTDGGVL